MLYPFYIIIQIQSLPKTKHRTTGHSRCSVAAYQLIWFIRDRDIDQRDQCGIYSFIVKAKITDQVNMRCKLMVDCMKLNVRDVLIMGLIFGIQVSLERQQNYMSVQVKEKHINYNETQFYRANPYVNQGYIPTSSLKNRKQPQFTTQIPQGIDYFDASNKKHFTQITKKSVINQQNLLTNPQKYPYQNRIANDINYHRNLNTIDIEGANASSKKSKAMKNRIKAQQQLKRRNAVIITPILWNGLSDQQIRRKLAEEQLERINSREKESKAASRRYHSQSKLPVASEHYGRNHYRDMKDEGIQSDILTLEKYLAYQNKEQEGQSASNPQIIKRETNTPNGARGRYQSEENINKLLENKLNTDLKYEVQSNGSGYVVPPSSMSSNLNNQIRQYFEKERLSKEREQMSHQYKMQFRQLNPTNLSYEGSIVKNSSIFSNLGKNIAIG